MESKVYKEKQGFFTWWLFLLFFGLLGFECYRIYQDFLLVKEINITTGFWILILLMICISSIRLRTKVDTSGVQISFFPFVIKKKWLWTDLTDVYVRKYTLMDFGGWGYRMSSQGVAYNTKGSNGIQLVLKNGKRIMIGTQQPDELKKYIDLYFKK